MNIFILLAGAMVALHFGMTEGLVGSIKVTLFTLMMSFILNVWHHLQQFDANHEEKRTRLWHGMLFVLHSVLYLGSCGWHATNITRFNGDIGWEELLLAGQPELGQILLWGGITLSSVAVLFFAVSNRWRFEKSETEKHYEWHAKDRRDHMK